MTLASPSSCCSLTVPVAGGRLSRLEEVRIRWVWLVVVAFAIQVVLVTVVPEGDETFHRVAHVVHLRAGGRVHRCGTLGAALPVGRRARRAVELHRDRGERRRDAGVARRARGRRASTCAPASSRTRISSRTLRSAFLGDVFAIPAGWPGANVFSVGDAVMVVGAFLVLHAATGSRLFASGRRRGRRLSAPLAR